MPQSYCLGHDLNYYTFHSFTNEIENFEKKINSFFGQEKKFPKLQTGGNTNFLKLNTNQEKKIKKIYSSDFDLLKIIS